MVWALPISLAATHGIDFSFFSSRYLDVSLPWVGHVYLCIQHTLIRESRDQYSFVSYPKLFADFHALRRLLMPRHPPCALSNLTTEISNSHNLNLTTFEVKPSRSNQRSRRARFDLPSIFDSASQPNLDLSSFSTRNR